ncbi:MAG: nucleoside recognition domain-containing protein [Syntrophaceae bacterium]
MEIVALVSRLIIPVFLLFVVAYGVYRKVPVFDSFVTGAKDGFSVVLRIFPYILAIFIAIKCFQASGAFGMISGALAPALSYIGVPAEVLSVAVIKPLSGSASLGAFTEVIKATGPDSAASRISAVIMGSAETTFYVLAVYLGAVSIKKTKYLVPVCLIADLIGMTVAVLAVKLFFY